MEHHVNWPTAMGARVLINDGWYKLQPRTKAPLVPKRRCPRRSCRARNVCRPLTIIGSCIRVRHLAFFKTAEISL